MVISLVVKEKKKQASWNDHELYSVKDVHKELGHSVTFVSWLFGLY